MRREAGRCEDRTTSVDGDVGSARTLDSNLQIVVVGTTFVAGVDPQLAVTPHVNVRELAAAIEDRHPLGGTWDETNLTAAAQLNQAVGREVIQ